MKRFVSLDFMRGIAIFMMVVFHIPMRWYDRGWLEGGDPVDVYPLPLVLLLSIIFFGAWAGFFLMVSATGNMISMQRNLERGKGPWKVVSFQIVGGILLLVTAMFVESTIGYHGYLGELVLGRNRWDMVLWRGFHMETIHTIAVCIILNGVVQGILSLKGGYRKMGRNITIYLLLAILLVAATPLVYHLSREIYPGYPFREVHSDLADRNISVQYPVLGETPIHEVGIRFVVMLAAGQPEPIFPYLALSFLGSIIGIVLCSGDRKRLLPRYGIPAGMMVLFSGLAGLGSTFLSGKADIHDLADHFYELPGLYPDLWFWWFLFLSGGFIISVLLVIRLVEYRGRSSAFAERTLFVRRYGFVAFTVYTYQFIDVIPRWSLGLVPCIDATYPYPSRMDVLPVLILVPMTVLLWEVVLRSWEKVDYFMGMEWVLARISEFMTPSRRDFIKTRKWYQVARLSSEEYLYHPDWIDIVDRKENSSTGKDRNLALALSIAGLIVPLISILALHIGRSSIRSEGKNWRNTAAMVLGTVGSVLWSSLFIVLLFAPKVTV